MATVPEEVRGPAKGRPGDEPVVVFEDVRLAFDDNVVLDGISFKLYPGFTKIFIGASGSGKSTVLKGCRPATPNCAARRSAMAVMTVLSASPRRESFRRTHPACQC